MIKKYNEFLNESIKFISYKFNPSDQHNPFVDILEGHIDEDSYITYGIYIKDADGIEKGTEFMEYYVGSNYKEGSKKSSNSRNYAVNKIPAKFKSAWEELKNKYNKEYK